MKRIRTLYVKQTDFFDLVKKWGMELALTLPDDGMGTFLYFIQSTKTGKVNWDKNSVYTLRELIERNNIKIVQ